MRGIIAECGNHHFGNLTRAKELVTAAKDCGASYVKFQAIDPFEFTGGSMPREFYRDCDLGMSGNMALINHAEKVGIPIFFSVFGTKYIDLIEHYPKMPFKLSGEQFRTCSPAVLRTLVNHWHGREIVVSVPADADFTGKFDLLCAPNVSVLYVTPYLSIGDLTTILAFRQVLKRPIGYSCHVTSIENCKKAIWTYNAKLIEKHFNLWGSQVYDKTVYRDSIHATDREGLAELCKSFRDKELYDERVFV